jgi:methylglutaconyl-CoA hydratase
VSSHATIELELRGQVGVVTLARPERHNAFDELVVAELTEAIRTLEGDPESRVLCLAAKGSSFCAGADLEWMRRAAALTPEESYADARRLATLLATLDRCEKPTIARVQGAAFGGGVGLLAACDVVVAVSSARFALSEVRLGLVPAIVGPYVVAAIGERAARRHFVTAEPFSAAEAHRMGLVSELVPDEAALDARIAGIAGALLQGGPAAIGEAKALLRSLRSRPIDGALIDETAATLARVRASPEAEEGIAAFLQGRKPGWRSG